MEDYSKILDEMREHGMIMPKKNVSFSVRNAKEVLTNAMSYFLSLNGEKLVWLPEYDEIANWLENNNGRGLFMHGDCGLGKSLIARIVIPAILLKYCRKVFAVLDSSNINNDIDGSLRKAFLVIDDMGLESEANIYGNKRYAIQEYLDNAEKSGNILIITTNLNAVQIAEKYGPRAIERITSTTIRVKISGKSFRK